MLSAECNFPPNACTDSMAEIIMPGIYLSKSFLPWQEERLRANNFTHVIIIDKHIQELYYPDQNGSIFKHNALESSEQRLQLNKEFDVIDLNFGDKTYLTTVLPNCYRAVRFINKALQAGGTILVIDCKGGEQKCITIVVAYLMYKYNINFNKAFARLKETYKNANLDRYYIRQLYEYEPILKVQRAHSCGHSCSRELKAAALKRKRPIDEELHPCNNITTDNHNGIADADGSDISDDAIITTASLLNNFNPLNKFNAMDIREESIAADNAANGTASNICSSVIDTDEIKISTLLPIKSGDAEEAGIGKAATIKYTSPGKHSNSWNYYEDYLME